MNPLAVDPLAVDPLTTKPLAMNPLTTKPLTVNLDGRGPAHALAGLPRRRAARTLRTAALLLASPPAADELGQRDQRPRRAGLQTALRPDPDRHRAYPRSR